MPAFRRRVFGEILQRARESRRLFIQVLAGPRQAGKTTLALQVTEAAEIPSHYVTADEPALKDREWIQAQWEVARIRGREARGGGTLLVLDEVQRFLGGLKQLSAVG